MSREDQNLLMRDDSMNFELDELDEPKTSAEKKEENNNFLETIQSVVPQLMDSPDAIYFLRTQTTPYFKMAAHFVEQEKQIKRLKSQLEDQTEKGKIADKKLLIASETEKEQAISLKTVNTELQKIKQEKTTEKQQMNTQIENLETELHNKTLECQSKTENLNKFIQSNSENEKEINRLNNDKGMISDIFALLTIEMEEDAKRREVIKTNEERIALDRSSADQMKKHLNSRHEQGLEQTLKMLDNYMNLKPEEKGGKNLVEMKKKMANSKRIAEWGSTNSETNKKVILEKDISNDRKLGLQAFKSAPPGWGRLNQKLSNVKK